MGFKHFVRFFAAVTLAGVAVLGTTFLRANRRIDRDDLRPLPSVDPPPGERSVKPVIDHGILANGGLDLASQYTGRVDTLSMVDLRGNIEPRGRKAVAELLSLLESPGTRRPIDEIQLHYALGTVLVYEDRLHEAMARFRTVLENGPSAGLPDAYRQVLVGILGVVSLRIGEAENCVECIGPSSCIFPIEARAAHQNEGGSRQAIEYFKQYLEMNPGDIRIHWLLNLAYMTLGEYPDGVPAEFLVPIESFESKADMGRFENVAPLVGINARGPNLAGGSVFDDFTGDGLPDLLATSLDVDRGASLFVNRGDGTFDDRSHSAGLDEQVYALNAVHADIDNDGDLDVLLLRGGWEKPMRMSLLLNDGAGVFEDITMASGLGEPIATESAAWGDFDNDGLVDLFVCGEYLLPSGDTPAPDSRNRSRLYHNEGDGKFKDIAAEAGISSRDCAKGSAWGDYDGDGLLDLFVSNMNGPCRLYRNQSGGRFRDVAPQLGLLGPTRGFACWFWDYDNDGHLDLYVNDYSSYLADFVAHMLGIANPVSAHPRLYRNRNGTGFEDVTRQVGLDRPMMPMGCNFADIDNDGYLDMYLGTGRMSLEHLVPNLMFQNIGGRRFEDATMASGTGHLQKGHGISFADWDCDGDVDLFVEAGGAVPGDRSFNLMFQNPGVGNAWLKVSLVGKTTNSAALGARIRAMVQSPDGSVRTVYRTVGNNSSFGGNSLVQTIGLGDAARVQELHVTWPASGVEQIFYNVPAKLSIEITEGSDCFKVLDQRPIGLAHVHANSQTPAHSPKPSAQ